MQPSMIYRENLNTMFKYISQDDLRFKEKVESGELPAKEFDHMAHLRLAYIYLSMDKLEYAMHRMRANILLFLKKAGINPLERYNETLTFAWMHIIHYHMFTLSQKEEYENAEAFFTEHSMLLDSNYIHNYYSQEQLNKEDEIDGIILPDLLDLPSQTQLNA